MGKFSWDRSAFLRKLFLALLDLLFVYLALLPIVLLSLEGLYSQGDIFRALLERLPFLAAIYMLCFFAAGFYSILWRYAGAGEMLRIVAAGLCGCVLSLLCNRLLGWYVSRGGICIHAITLTSLVAASRILWRILRDRFYAGPASPTRVLIVGAGSGGAYAAGLCMNNPRQFGSPAAFVDDDPQKRGMRIHGVPVLGGLSDIGEIVAEKSIDEIIIAIPSMPEAKRREVAKRCHDTQKRTTILLDPGDGAAGAAPVRELDFSDLLFREEVVLDTAQVSGYITDKTVLVTGGGGSVGSELCRQILPFGPRLLLVLDIYENSAYALEMELKGRYGQDAPVLVRIGSVRDQACIERLFREYKPQVVFHAAAHKHVPLMERSPAEAVKNNILGSRNLLRAAAQNGAALFVQLSTDKAVTPQNAMGASKRFCEMLVQYYARHSPMRAVAVRFGNVLGSNGSVIPLFEAQIRAGGPVRVTDPEMTRYFMTIPEAARLVLAAGALAAPGVIYVLDMGEPVRILDLAERVIRFYGYTPGVDMEICVTGRRPGESLHEALLRPEERAAMGSTPHPRILAAPPLEIDEEALLSMLARLEQAAGAAEAPEERLRELLQEAAQLGG